MSLDVFGSTYRDKELAGIELRRRAMLSLHHDENYFIPTAAHGGGEEDEDDKDDKDDEDDEDDHKDDEDDHKDDEDDHKDDNDDNGKMQHRVLCERTNCFSCNLFLVKSKTRESMAKKTATVNQTSISLQIVMKKTRAIS